jgi:AcrR family transcriptional regulator
MAASGTRSRGNYARGLATREQIVTATRDVMAERGFHGATMAAIAKRAGLTRAGVLHHFESKEHLLAAAMESRYAENRQWFQAQIKAGVCVLDIYVELMDRQIRRPESATLLLVLASASIDADHPAHNWYRARYAYFRQATPEFVRSEQERGVIRCDLDPLLISIQLVALMEGLLLQWLNDQRAFDPVAAMRAFTDSLRPPKPGLRA